MTDYLIQHAIANVWCTPEQDRQSAFKPVRLTKSMGTYRSININFTDILLPNISDRFHVYQIGQIDPDLINLIEIRNTWIPISRLCRDYNLLIDLYTVDGIQYPRFESWIMITNKKNVVIAVKEQSTINLLSTKDFYIRFYTNAYFGSVRKNNNLYNYIYVYGVHVKTLSDRDNIISRVNDKSAINGKTYGFINGKYSTTFNSNTIHIGDLVEIVHDTSIKNTIEFKVDTLDTFSSILDSKNKYLLAPNYNSSIIDYYDDIDVYIYKTVNGVESGVFYHKNAVDAMRMVTHKAWALPVQYVEAYQTNNSFLSNYADLNIRLYIRNSGYERPLVEDANYIKTLYTLDNASVRKALLGIDSVLTEWKASTLENSFYTKIMRSRSFEIDRSLVESAYGYNITSTLLGKVSQVVSNDLFDIPFTSKQYSNTNIKSLVYAYDTSGKLMPNTEVNPVTYEWNDHLKFPTVSTDGISNIGAKHVEIIPFRHSSTLNRYSAWPEPNGVTYTFSSKSAYRAYRCLITQSGPTFDWEDITNKVNDYYIIHNGSNDTFTVEWTISTSVYLCLIISDVDFLHNNIAITPDNGYLQFSINPSSYFSGYHSELHFPPIGSLELWLNGYSLVEGIDYFVEYPQVTIINKRYIKGNKTDINKIQYRGLGFCDEDCVYRNKSDIGWVKYGQLSRNNHYDLVSSRNLRFVANGRTLLLSDIRLPENNGAIVPIDDLNGTPYLIQQLDVPLFDNVDTTLMFSRRKAAYATNSAVSNYMSTKVDPQVDPAQLSAALSRYELYSPFVGAIVNAILDNDLDNAVYASMPSNSLIESTITPYKALLRVDPTQASVGGMLDKDIVIIHPHTRSSAINLTFGQWRFLKRVVDIYTKGKVDISQFITIVQ